MILNSLLGMKKILKKICLVYNASIMNTHRCNFEETKCLYFFIKESKFLEKYNDVWEKLSNVNKKGFHSEKYNEKYLKTKI